MTKKSEYDEDQQKVIDKFISGEIEKRPPRPNATTNYSGSNKRGTARPTKNKTRGVYGKGTRWG